MAGDTVITVQGNLVADPEVRFTPQGKSVTSFTVASTPRRFDRQSNEWIDGDALFLRCSAWNALGEHIAESLTRGAKVLVVGRLVQRSYQTSSGDKRTVVELRAEDVGPSLVFATAKTQRVNRIDRAADEIAPERDPWRSVPDQEAAAPVAAGSSGSAEPPF